MSKQSWKEILLWEPIKAFPEAFFSITAISLIFHPIPQLGKWNIILISMFLYWSRLITIWRFKK